MKILPRINGHDDLLRLTDEERIALCAEIREFLIDHVSKTGGHLAGNLGVVELTVALETIYDTRKDRLIFDVGHQSYVHKLLTGRQDAFDSLRQFGGISGFPKPTESETDAFVAGHASSSVSIGLGMARARTLQKQDYQVAVLIGDGAATGGMAYEGMNNAADSKEPMVIILNDNEMSIGRNVGGISQHLSRIRSNEKYLGIKRRYRSALNRTAAGRHFYALTRKMKNRVKRFLLQTTLFENMGLTYLGPVDGHDLTQLLSVLRIARDLNEPVLVHVVTKKGTGYQPAEEDPAQFHGVGKFDPKTGKKLGAKVETFSDSFGKTLAGLALRNGKVCAITAAMPTGTGLLPYMSDLKDRLFDVGIAEEHAVSMAGGLAKQGMIPVVALYSTFLQRSYDQLMQDTAMLHLHVVLAIDRAGLVGDDGPTHHGVFDVGFLRQIPGMKILAPASMREQQNMLTWAVESYDGPIAVRYPRGTDGEYHDSDWRPGSGVVCHRQGDDVTLITYGVMINSVLAASDQLEAKNIHPTVLRLTCLSEIDVQGLLPLLSKNRTVVVLEEAASGSGIKEALAWSLREAIPELRFHGRDLGKEFVQHGSQEKLLKTCALDMDSIAQFVEEVLQDEK